MNKFKFLNMLAMLALALLMTACPPDPDPTDPKEIYGTFAGTATRIITSLSTSEEIDNVTESASLIITKVNDKMNVKVDGEKDYLVNIPGLPALKVSGDKNYRYTYKSDDGSVNITILSPDFDAVTFDMLLIAEEDDVRVEVSFKGRRI